MRVEITALAKRLTQTAELALQRAAEHARDAGHQEVTIDHVLFQILAVKDEDAELLLSAAGLERSDVLAGTRRRVASLAGGHSGRPGFDKGLWPWFEGAWLLASTELDQSRARTGALVWAAARHVETLGSANEALSALKAAAVRDALAPSPESAELFDLGQLEKLGRDAEDEQTAKAREQVSKERAAAAEAAAKAEAAKLAKEADAVRAEAAAKAAEAAEAASAAAAEAQALAEAARTAADAAAAAAAPDPEPEAAFEHDPEDDTEPGEIIPIAKAAEIARAEEEE